jgi:hypothetical protein
LPRPATRAGPRGRSSTEDASFCARGITPVGITRQPSSRGAPGIHLVRGAGTHRTGRAGHSPGAAVRLWARPVLTAASTATRMRCVYDCPDGLLEHGSPFPYSFALSVTGCVPALPHRPSGEAVSLPAVRLTSTGVEAAWQRMSLTSSHSGHARWKEQTALEPFAQKKAHSSLLCLEKKTQARLDR